MKKGDRRNTEAKSNGAQSSKGRQVTDSRGGRQKGETGVGGGRAGEKGCFLDTQFKVSCKVLISVKAVQYQRLLPLLPCRTFLHVFLLGRDRLIHLLRMSLFYSLFGCFFSPPSPWVSPEESSLALLSSLSTFFSSLYGGIHAFRVTCHLPAGVYT